jgi:hypothetical protein
MGMETAHTITPPAEGPPWDDRKVGLKVGPLVHTITPEMARDFCAAMPADVSACEARGVMPPTLLATDYIPPPRGHLELGVQSGRTALQADVFNQLGEVVAAGTVSVVE